MLRASARRAARRLRTKTSRERRSCSCLTYRSGLAVRTMADALLDFSSQLSQSIRASSYARGASISIPLYIRRQAVDLLLVRFVSKTSEMRKTVHAALRFDADIILAAAEANEQRIDRQMDLARPELYTCPQRHGGLHDQPVSSKSTASSKDSSHAHFSRPDAQGHCRRVSKYRWSLGKGVD